MSIMDSIRGLVPPSTERSLALIASELRTIRRLMEVRHREDGYPPYVDEREAERHPLPEEPVEQESEEERIEQRMMEILLKKGAGVDDEDTRSFEL